MKFSIIIPVYNIEHYIVDCLNSIFLQASKQYDIEVLLVDDCSTDNSYEIIENLSEQHKNISLYSTLRNSGPGAARNIGMKNATGDWIMFVDGDDLICENALSELYNHIKYNDVNLLKEESRTLDVISYDFKYSSSSNVQSRHAKRQDIDSLYKTKDELLGDYLSLKMDGSVIFTLMKREFLIKNNIFFSDGIHEDVDFMFKIYYFSQKIGVLNQPLYIKNNREDSIVNTISEAHINGFFRAFNEIYEVISLYKLESDNIINQYTLGVIAICATRIREISNKSNVDHYSLYLKLFTEVDKILESKKLVTEHFFKTKYIKIYDYFLSIMREDNINIVDKLDCFLGNINKKNWSCYDLHNSLFLAPDEVRTCCKRFFVDNKIKGDVSLLTKETYKYQDFNIVNIMNEKENLLIDINKGFSEKCGGCPYLEFKDWGQLKVEHISFEYHSICNMKCNYCSDTFYGGEKPQYDIEGLMNSMANNGQLLDCKSIVWGGGEPTLEKSFTTLLNKIKHDFPKIQQRVITNATTLSSDVKDGLNRDLVSVVTSIDAGSPEVFYEVRKNKSFRKVFANLASYSEEKPENITIKYIFLEENSFISEVEGFIAMIKEYSLIHCNFQISYDFKEELVRHDSLICITVLHGLLVELNVPLVFLDDLLINRLKQSDIEYSKLSTDLNKLGFDRFLPKNKYDNIVIWGAGKQAEYLLSDSIFLKQCNIVYLVDNTPSKIGGKLMGYEILDPSVLVDNNYPVIISAVQSAFKILKQYKALGLDESRLLKDLIL